MHEAVEQRDLALVVVERRAHDHAHVLLVQRLGGAGEDRGEVDRVDQRDEDADQPRAPRRQASRTAAHRVAMFLDDTPHEVARLVGHVLAPVKHAGDPRDRDAGQISYLPDRHPSRPVRPAVGDI